MTETKQGPDLAIQPFAEGGIGDLLCKAAHAYREEYVFSTEDGPDHQPTEFEALLLEDFWNGLVSDESFFGIIRQLAGRAAKEEAANSWRPIESAPDDFEETYFLVRPRGLHPARGTPYVPTVVTRLDNELFTPANHLDPLQWSKGGVTMNGPTSNILEADLEWLPLPR